MLFSVIVPVYKAERYLEKCVNSILQQTYTDFELILVDDGSPDKCGEMCDAFAQKDKRIKVIHQKNGGVSVARNNGLSIIKGQYYLFVDADDYIVDDTLMRLADSISKNNPDIIVFGYTNIYEDKEEPVIYRADGYSLQNIKEKFINDEWRNFACNKCFKAEMFTDKKFPIGQCYEDLYLVPQLIVAAKSIVVLPYSLYAYNQTNVNSITKNVDSKKEYDFFLALMSNYHLAVQLDLVCQEECRCSALERAYTTILRYLEDKKLSEEKLNFIHEFCAEQMQHNLVNNKNRYKIYHNIAKIYWKQRNIILFLCYLSKYIASKLIYSLEKNNKLLFSEV